MRGAFNVPKAPYVELTSPYGKSRLSPSELVFGGLAKLDEKDAQQFFQWVNGFPAKALQIYPSRPVRNPQELALGEVKAPLPLLGRLYWLSTFLQQSREPLVSFLRLSNRFEQEFLKGQFEEAKATLDEIEAALGLSVWLIETRIALLQRWKGWRPEGVCSIADPCDGVETRRGGCLLGQSAKRGKYGFRTVPEPP